MRDNRTKRIMSSGGLALGVSLTVADPFVAEVVGAAGFDFVLIDAEHAPIAIDQLQMMLIALRASESTVLVRPVANDPAQIKQILDLGAEGLVVPGVEDAAACAAAVAAARYPPLGGRGFGPRRAARLDGGRAAYLARADEEIALLVMIESAAAVADIDAILKTPGLDGIMVGPADLAVTWATCANSAIRRVGRDHRRAGRVRAAVGPVRDLRGPPSRRPASGRRRARGS